MTAEPEPPETASGPVEPPDIQEHFSRMSQSLTEDYQSMQQSASGRDVQEQYATLLREQAAANRQMLSNHLNINRLFLGAEKRFCVCPTAAGFYILADHRPHGSPLRHVCADRQ